MTEMQLRLEDIFALPEPSIQAYLQFKGWPSRNFLADRITVVIYYANDGWLGDVDRALVRLKDFTPTANLPDTELITRLQGTGKEITVLMTRFDLVLKLLTVGDNLYSFGSNERSQLGLGDTSNRIIPTLVISLIGLKVKAISGGGIHTAIITEDDNLYSFGDNGNGQLGLGDNTDRNVPILVTALAGLKVKAVSCGNLHTMIITKDGNLYAFGNNFDGQLGLGNNIDTNMPALVIIPDGSKIKAVSCGSYYTMIITENDNLYSFGNNISGQLGLGITGPRYTPILVTIPNGLKVKAVSCGGSHTVIITEDGNLYSFGDNSYGQLGLRLRKGRRTTPTLVASLGSLKVKAVSCGLVHTVIIMENSNFYSFGRNDAGQLGLGDTTDKNVPTLVTALAGLRVKAVSCGSEHTIIITVDNNLYSFGNNAFGQLGLVGYTDNIINTPTLVNIPDTLKVIAASCGTDHTLVIAK